jgi:hypothetical protein
MTVSYIRPIIPDTAPGKAAGASARAVGQPLPLVVVPASRPARQTNVLYRRTAIDHRGRVADRHITAALAWDPGTRLSIREHDGLLGRDRRPTWRFKLPKEGYLRLPADARRAAGLASGDRFFLTQIEEIVLITPGAAPHFQLMLSKVDRMDQSHGPHRGGRRGLLRRHHHPDQGRIGVTVAVEVLPSGTLERPTGKLQLVLGL